MYKYRNTAARLAAWRKHAKEMAALYAKRGAEVPPEYARPTLPPGYFGQQSPPTPTRDERGARYHYGEGLGPDIADSRPGFRFRGYADEVVDLRHTGWYGDDEGTGFTMFRGVVYQIPARGGATQYLAGYEWGESGARSSFHGGGGTIAIGRGDIYESDRDAAYAADSMAERAAEDERDYQREQREEEEREEEEREQREAQNHDERMALADVPMNGAD